MIDTLLKNDVVKKMMESSDFEVGTGYIKIVPLKILICFGSSTIQAGSNNRKVTLQRAYKDVNFKTLLNTNFAYEPYCNFSLGGREVNSITVYGSGVQHANENPLSFDYLTIGFYE